VVRNHCASRSALESQMQHPIKVRAILAYGEASTCRIEDAKGACLIKIAEHCVVASSWQGQIGVGCNRGGFFGRSLSATYAGTQPYCVLLGVRAPDCLYIRRSFSM
jgi:hypothetical protein